LFFRLRNKDIPITKETTYDCKSCKEVITIPPMELKIKEKKKKSTSKMSHRLAKKSLVSYGWTKEEADDILNEVSKEHDTTDVASLVKLAFSYAEPIAR